MSWFLTNLIASFFLPPLNGLLPLAAGFLVRRRWPRLGWALSVLGFALVLAFSMPWFGWQLIAPLEERYPVLSEAALRDLDVDAVVILGAGRYRRGGRRSPANPGSFALRRLCGKTIPQAGPGDRRNARRSR